jgi:amidase
MKVTLFGQVISRGGCEPGTVRVHPLRRYTSFVSNHLPLSEQSALIANRKISPRELLEAHLECIAKEDPSLRAFVVVAAEQAREAASASEARQLRGESIGPLDGIPVTIKDSLDVAGLPTLAGSRLRLGHIAAKDSACAARLRAAGAVILGKTNCPEFLANYETDNFITGRTANPHDRERSAGGSSGGEAAAIAAFCSAGGVGSDGGGSVRIPAHFCGIVGLKPTPGRISAAGHFPTIAHPGGLLGVVGPMARTAKDVRMLFDALQGYDTEDPFSAPVPLRQPSTAGVNIGVWEQFYQVPVRESMKQAVARAGSKFASAGFRVEAFTPRGLERSPNLWSFFFNDLTDPFKKRMMEGRESDVHWTGKEFLFPKTPETTGVQVVENLALRDKMRSNLLRQMEEFPVILMPVCSIPAFLPRERAWTIDGKTVNLFQAMMCVTPFNLLGLPAISIPFGKSEEGLPVSVQLVGRPYGEELLLALAMELEEL